MDSPSSRNSSVHEPFVTKSKSDFITSEKQLAIKEALDHLFIMKLYQQKEEVDEKPGGLCKGCLKFTSNKCHTCNDSYCQDDCQHPNWKMHEAQCKKFVPSEHKSPTSDKDTEPDEKLVTDRNSSPFAKLAQQLNSTPLNDTTKRFPGRKSEPAMSKSSTRFNHRNGYHRNNKKKLSLSDTDSKSKERRSFGKNNYKKKLQEGSSSSAETESASNSVFSKCSTPVAKTKGLEPKSNGVNLERRKTKKVIFFYKEPDEPIHWVMDEDDMDEFESIHNTLAKECDDYECIEPKVGLVCGCKYSDEWYRARVIALQPKVCVHYIDYGNSAEASDSLLKKLPPEIRMVKDLVYRIEFDESTPKKYKNKDLSGKALKIKVNRITESNVEMVDLVSDNELESTDSEMTENETEEIPTTKKLIDKSAMSLIKNGSEGMISFLPGESKIRYGLIIPEGSEKEIEMDIKELDSLDSIELNPVRAGFEGDYVLVIDYDDQRRRGKIVSTLCSTYYVLLIDYGIVIAVENLYQLTGKSEGLFHLGANVIINEILSSEKAKNMEKSLYQVTGEQDCEGRWPCELKDTSSKEVIARGYIQSPPEEGVTVPLFMPIESGSLCELSIVTGVRSCYVRPADEQAARKSLEMTVKMTEFLVKADPLTRPPEIGKMYAAKNKTDDCFHRAVIKSMKNDKFEVLFVDYGTVEKVEMKDLKPLPVRIKVVPFFAVEVTLGGITVESLSDSAKKYLNELIEKNLTLVLNFCHGESDEVVLMEKKSGIIVNEVFQKSENEKNDKDEVGEKNGVMFDGNEVEEEEEEEKEEEEEEEEEEKGEDENVKDENLDDCENGLRVKSPQQDECVVMKSELKSPNICTNTKYNLVLQYVEKDQFFASLTFWMANVEDESFSHVSNLVNSKIGKYCCEAQESYRPKVEEMCLALYEDDWYRALTLSVKDDNYEVFFIDFGNTCTLKPKAIRKIKQEFMEYPAWAFKCTISGLGKLIGKPGLKMAVYEELVRRMNSICKDVLITKHEFEIYYVAIPEIEEILNA